MSQIIFVYNLLGAGSRVPVLLEAQHKLKVPIQKYTKVVKKFRRKILADRLGLGPYMLLLNFRLDKTTCLTIYHIISYPS
jgi:hypothetical protein